MGGINMKMLSEIIETLWSNMKMSDLPVNVLVDNELCDIKDFYYDTNICEYVLVLTDGYEYIRKENGGNK